MTDPLTIYQIVIDKMSTAVMTGDTDICLRHVAVPFTVITRMGTFTATNEEDMVQAFLTFVREMKARGATDYIRLAREARYLAPDVIEGVHVTHTIRGAQRMIAPFAARARLAQQGEIWRITHMNHAIVNTTWPIRMWEPAAHSDIAPAPFQQ